MLSIVIINKPLLFLDVQSATPPKTPQETKNDVSISYSWRNSAQIRYITCRFFSIFLTPFFIYYDLRLLVVWSWLISFLYLNFFVVLHQNYGSKIRKTISHKRTCDCIYRVHRYSLEIAIYNQRDRSAVLLPRFMRYEKCLSSLCNKMVKFYLYRRI